MEKNINQRLGYRPIVLVVDDDPELCDLLQQYLNKKGFFVEIADGSKKAKKLMNQQSFSAVVLDVQMPDQDGISLLDEWRMAGNNIPVIMLTAMGKDPEHRVQGLSLGADDYLAKPFEPEELALRLFNVIARIAKNQHGKKKMSFGQGMFDRVQKKLWVNKKLVSLTSAEERLFCYLLDRAGQTVSRDELYKSQVVLGGERSIDVHIARIRQKIGDSKNRPQYLVTIRHQGYEMRIDQ